MSFYIGKLKIRISFLFCAVICLIAFFDEGYMMPAFLSVCAHEGAHLFAMLILKEKVREVSFEPFGILIKRESESRDFYKNLIISISGCVLNFVVFSVLFAVHYFGKNETLLVISAINFALFLINIFPIYGLDGAQVLMLVLERYKSEEFAETTVKITSVTSALILLIIGVIIYFKVRQNPSLALLSLYLLFQSVSNQLKK